MTNVLSEQLKQQVIALGQLGWSLRRIQKETGVRRETASIYLKAAGIAVPSPGRRKQQPAKPAIPMTTGLPAELSLLNPNPNDNPCAGHRPFKPPLGPIPSYRSLFLAFTWNLFSYTQACTA